MTFSSTKLIMNLPLPANIAKYVRESIDAMEVK